MAETEIVPPLHEQVSQLADAGWTCIRRTTWQAPDGSLWIGPHGAWRELDRRRKTALQRELADLRTRLSAAEQAQKYTSDLYDQSQTALAVETQRADTAEQRLKEACRQSDEWEASARAAVETRDRYRRALEGAPHAAECKSHYCLHCELDDETFHLGPGMWCGANGDESFSPRPCNCFKSVLTDEPEPMSPAVEKAMKAFRKRWNEVHPMPSANRKEVETK